MKQGWYGDDYLQLFDLDEIGAATKRYGVHDWLPSYRLVGLRNWDDLIVQSEDGGVFSLPSVPMLARHLEPADLPISDLQLDTDVRLSDKVRWYVTPIAFGGSSDDEGNIAWVALEQHAQLVAWWNDRYREGTHGSGSS